MKPAHPAVEILGFMRPDEVAECVDGIVGVPGLYEALWGLLEAIPYVDPEIQEEPVYGGSGALKAHFDKLSPEHQAALDVIALAHDAKYQAWKEEK